jgi:hypothetical protein
MLQALRKERKRPAQQSRIIRIVALDSGRQSPHVNVTNIYMGGKSCITMFCCGPSD